MPCRGAPGGRRRAGRLFLCGCEGVSRVGFGAAQWSVETGPDRLRSSEKKQNTRTLDEDAVDRLPRVATILASMCLQWFDCVVVERESSPHSLAEGCQANGRSTEARGKVVRRLSSASRVSESRRRASFQPKRTASPRRHIRGPRHDHRSSTPRRDDADCRLLLLPGISRPRFKNPTYSQSISN